MVVFNIILLVGIVAAENLFASPVNHFDEAHKLLYRNSRPYIPDDAALKTAAQHLLNALPMDLSGDVAGLLGAIGIDFRTLCDDAHDAEAERIAAAWRRYVESLTGMPSMD